MVTEQPRKMLGERLLERGVLTERQLELAVREQKREKQEKEIFCLLHFSVTR